MSKKNKYNILEIALPEDYREGLIDIGWNAEGIGCGHLSFNVKDGQIHCSSEGMSRKFVKAVLNKLVDVAFFEERNDE